MAQKARANLVALMEAVSQDVAEHWLDGDYLNRPDVGRALRDALDYCAKKHIDPPLEAIAVVGRFYHLQNAEREERDGSN